MQETRSHGEMVDGGWWEKRKEAGMRGAKRGDRRKGGPRMGEEEEYIVRGG